MDDYYRNKLTYTGQLELSVVDYMSPLCHTMYAAVPFLVQLVLT